MVTNSNFIILIDIRYIKKKGTYLLLSAKSWIASIHGNWKENNHNCKSIIMEEDDTKPYWSFLLGLTRMFNIGYFLFHYFPIVFEEQSQQTVEICVGDIDILG
jgi:hypothetical protein